jgi:hypothetical protein
MNSPLSCSAVLGRGPSRGPEIPTDQPGWAPLKYGKSAAEGGLSVEGVARSGRVQQMQSRPAEPQSEFGLTCK